MQRNLDSLKNTQFDLVIIGGGITGACLAWDAINRGLSVALIDKNDFGAETSSASSKLIHGGIRYLQQGKLAKVRESALERAYYQKIAPQLTKYIPFVVPAYKSLLKSKWVLYVGMLAYQLICFGQNSTLQDKKKKIPGWKSLSKAQISEYIPEVELAGVTGGVVFFESHMESSERMTLAFISSAVKKSAVVANYVSADSFHRDGNTVNGVNVTDQLSGEQFVISAGCVVNAAGPWIPLLNDALGESKLVTAFSKGAHIVTDKITENAAIALATKKQNTAIINRGGRHVFVIPWRGYSLIGTTYDAYEHELNDVRPTEDDINELISDINSALGQDVLSRDNVRYSYAGIYPLIDDEINTKVYQGTGEYQVIDHAEKEHIEGLVTVFGAKFTTARLLAEKAIDQISRKFTKKLNPCQTRSTPLYSGNIKDIIEFRSSKQSQYQALLSADSIDHLITLYGTDIDQVLAYAEKDSCWSQRLSEYYPDIEAQVIYAAEHEMVCHLDDFIFRRSGLGTLGNPGDRLLSRCNEILSAQLQWEPARQLEEMDRVKKYYQYK